MKFNIETEEEKQKIEASFENFIRKSHYINKNEESLKQVRKAFQFGRKAHAGMKRSSGEPYIIHPIEVADIITNELNMGTTTVICALLHDVIEDTNHTAEDIEINFGARVAFIVESLTRIKQKVFDFTTVQQEETLRNILLTMADDIRVVLIKIADRLHNLRNIDKLQPDKQLKAASETMYIYAPLSYRLGLYNIKVELEDLTFKYFQPVIHSEISNKIQKGEKSRQSYIVKFTIPLIYELTKNGVKLIDVKGRPKTIYSIYRKMQNKNVSFEEVYDVHAVRIIFEPNDESQEVAECWKIYSIVTQKYQPKPERLRDWVTTPKSNGYESLHITVIGPDGKFIEVQIRSRRMDEIAEGGIAAHWKYKGVTYNKSELDNWLHNIKDQLKSLRDDSTEYSDTLRLNTQTNEVMIFTPKGHIKTMRKGSTVLDFAFEIHTELGYHCIGAKINHKLLPINHILKNGDQIELLSSKSQKPLQEWLHFVSTDKAKNKLKRAFVEERRASIQRGKEIINALFVELQINANSNIFRKLKEAFVFTTRDEMYARIGDGLITKENLEDTILQRSKAKFEKFWGIGLNKKTGHDSDTFSMDNDNESTLVLSDDLYGKNYTIAKCCNPIPGDNIIGYRSIDNFIAIHKQNCPTAVKLSERKGYVTIPARWETQRIMSYLKRIKIDGADRVGVINNITDVISKEFGVNMRSIHVECSDGSFKGSVDLYIYNTDDLDNLMRNLAEIKGVKNVYREQIEDA